MRSGERPLAGDELDERDREPELIGGGGHRFARELLGSHVRVATLARAGAGTIGERGRFDDAEVAELDVAGRRDQRVRRADVAMNEAERQAALVAGGVEVREAERELVDDEQRELFGRGPSR